MRVARLFRNMNFTIGIVMTALITLSALVGKRFGKTRILGMRNRTLEGSAAFFVSSLAILLLTCPPAPAVTAAVLGTLIELFAQYNLDNLLVPVGLALFLSVS